MPVEISEAAIRKLCHEIPEIRIRALKSIESKVLNAIRQNEPIVSVSIALLVKWLIRWFGQVQCNEIDRVLSLLLAILKSKYGPECIGTLGHSKVCREMQRIKSVLSETSFETRMLLQRIDAALVELRLSESSVSQKQSEQQISSLDPVHALSQADDATPTCDNNIFGVPANFVPVWEKPCASDMNSIKLLKASLRPDTEEANVQHALQFLNVAIDDYPAEYFLQPPYIFYSLKSLVDQKNRCATEIMDKFSHLTRAFQKRIKMRTLSKVYCPENGSDTMCRAQISVEKYFHDLFRSALDYFKDCADTPNRQDDINTCITVMLDLLELYRCSASDSSTLLDEILNELGNTVKFFRQTWMHSLLPESHRSHYVQLLSVTCSLASLRAQNCRKPYDNSDFMSLNSSRSGQHSQTDDYIASVSVVANERPVWLLELEVAMYDYAVEHFYSDLYNRMADMVKTDMCVQMPFRTALSNAVNVLKKSDTEVDSTNLLAMGLLAMDSMSVHKSLELSKKLLNTIVKCVPYFNGNATVQLNATQLLLRLISHEDVPIKRTMYRMCAQKMKYYFSSLMGGGQIRQHSSVQWSTQFLGVPLSVDILVETTCFGCTHPDLVIRENAETMLLLLLRSRTMLDAYWPCIWEILMPVMALIECYASKQTELGKAIMDFLDPDNTYCPFLELFKGNVRLLFAAEAAVRDEAVARLLYMVLSRDDEVDAYLPNIANISDVIPNSVCVLQTAYDPDKVSLSSGTFDSASMQPLVELLACDGVEPSVRKATFIQLNAMAQDPPLNDVLYTSNGFDDLILQALRNSLKTEHDIDYPDTAVPVVGIVAKMCVQYPRFRQELSQRTDVFCHLVRALMLFYHHETFKQDCAVGLFMLVFSDYITAGRLSLPVVCDRLLVPVVHAPHLMASPFNNKSQLEQMLGFNNDGDGDTHKNRWQYARLTFASLWFDGLKHIFNGSPNRQPLDYESTCRFAFDPALRLTSDDLAIVRATSINYTLPKQLQAIANATNHLDAQIGIAELTNYTVMPCDAATLGSSDLMTAVQRFCVTTPNTQSDETTFTAVLQLLAQLIRKGFYDVHIWVLEELRRPNCTYLTILKGCTATTAKLFASNCRFIGIVAAHSMRSTDNKVQTLLTECMEPPFNLLAFYFDRMVRQLDEHFAKRELDRLRALVALMRILTTPGQQNYVTGDAEFVSYVANKLLHLIAAIKSLAQAGSNFNKNCLMTVGNLLLATADDQTVQIQSKYVKLLSGLCGHADVELRATSWSILTQMSRSLAGATQLVKELAYLPGGFHACCLSTFLDTNEASVVRETAGCLFANLLKFRSGSRRLPAAVAPICAETQPIGSDDDVVGLVLEILMRQRFFTCLTNAFKTYWPHEVIDETTAAGSIITTCDIMRTYCAIQVNVIALQPGIVIDLHANGIVFEMFRLVPSVLLAVSRSAWLMYVEICNYMVSCVAHKPDILSQISVQEYAVVKTLLSCLDQNVYDDGCGQALSLQCRLGSVRLLEAISSTGSPLQICHLIADESRFIDHLLRLLEYGNERHKQHPDLCQSVLRLLGKLLAASQVNAERYAGGPTFAGLLDSALQSHSECEQRDVNFTETTDEDQRSEDQPPPTTASARLFQLLATFMQRVRGQPSLSEPAAIVMAMLLKCSKPARKVAAASGFLRALLSELDEMHAKFGMACSEFIRRHGDAKKEPILAAIRSLYNVILNWYSVDVMRCDTDAQHLCRLSIKLWPWIGTNQLLQVTYMRTLTFLSEDSVLMCKIMSTCHCTGSGASNTNTVLQLFVEFMVTETNRAKHPQSDLVQLQLAMRIVSNCCSCIEGRQMLIKMNALDSFNRLHPTVTKNQKPWPTVTAMWLRLYDILTRYPDPCVGVKHLSLLCTFVLKSPTLRLQSLVIMRNMAFAVANRAALLASDEYMYTMKSIIEAVETDGEQALAVITAIWKLTANSYKGKHAVRSGSLLTKIQALADRMQSLTNVTKQGELMDAIEMHAPSLTTLNSVVVMMKNSFDQMG